MTCGPAGHLATKLSGNKSAALFLTFYDAPGALIHGFPTWSPQRSSSSLSNPPPVSRAAGLFYNDLLDQRPAELVNAVQSLFDIGETRRVTEPDVIIRPEGDARHGGDFLRLQQFRAEVP